jgi:hypothetical protein
MLMINIIIILIRILPPYIEIFKVLDPHLGMTFEILRLSESGMVGPIRVRASGSLTFQEVREAKACGACTQRAG